jgi:hypothetical protein
LPCRIPWDALPKEEQGDEDLEKLFASVGRALSTWEMMEGVLGWIFGYLCGASQEGPARAYGVVASMNGRIDMLKEVFSCFEGRNNHELVAFPKFLDRVRQYGARRNEIAHGMAVSYTFNNDPRGFFWCPPHYNSRKRPSRAAINDAWRTGGGEAWLESGMGRYTYNSAQIGYYTNEFQKLREQASIFHASLMAYGIPKDVEEGAGDTGGG